MKYEDFPKLSDKEKNKYYDDMHKELLDVIDMMLPHLTFMGKLKLHFRYWHLHFINIKRKLGMYNLNLNPRRTNKNE